VRRITLLFTVALLLAGVFAPVALAVDLQCSSDPCLGTEDRDTLYERRGDGKPDTILGLDRGDRIYAYLFRGDRDLLFGNGGNDILDATDGDTRDELYGGSGEDLCYVDEGDFHWGCEGLITVQRALALRSR
jgi:hypothetical protein